MSFLDPSMEDLPLEVMVDILSRLPVKTIVHCKYVCKKWLKIILDSYFAAIQHSRSPAGIMMYHYNQYRNSEQGMLGILRWTKVEDDFEHHHLHHDLVMSLNLGISSIFQKSTTFLVGSVNGLLCLWQLGNGKSNIYICNPISREYIIIPGKQYSRECFAIFAYYFGFGSLTREYKVIRILREGKPSDPRSISRPSLFETKVYTLGTGQWRSISHVPYRLKGYGSFLNGHAHWIVDDEDSPEKICAFDFDKEIFELFPSPPPQAIDKSEIRTTLGVLKGCLCQCENYNYKLTIWVMKEYGIKKSWRKEIVIETSIDIDLDFLTCSSVYIIKGLKDGTILMANYTKKLFAYSPQKKTIVVLQNFDRFFRGLAYRPSFHRLQRFENERVGVF